MIDHTSIIFIIYIFHIHLSHPSIIIIILIFSVIMMIIINPSIINIIIIIYSAMMMMMMIVDDLPSIIIIIIIYSVMMMMMMMIMVVVDDHPSINIIPIPSTYSTLPLPTNLDDPLQKNSSWQQQTQRNKLHNLVYIYDRWLDG